MRKENDNVLIAVIIIVGLALGGAFFAFVGMEDDYGTRATKAAEKREAEAKKRAADREEEAREARIKKGADEIKEATALTYHLMWDEEKRLTLTKALMVTIFPNVPEDDPNLNVVGAAIQLCVQDEAKRLVEEANGGEFTRVLDLYDRCAKEVGKRLAQ